MYAIKERNIPSYGKSGESKTNTNSGINEQSKKIKINHF